MSLEPGIRWCCHHHRHVDKTHKLVRDAEAAVTKVRVQLNHRAEELGHVNVTKLLNAAEDHWWLAHRIRGCDEAGTVGTISGMISEVEVVEVERKVTV